MRLHTKIYPMHKVFGNVRKKSTLGSSVGVPSVNNSSMADPRRLLSPAVMILFLLSGGMVLLFIGCAHTPGKSAAVSAAPPTNQFDPTAAMKRAETECKNLMKTALEAPLHTQIGPRFGQIKEQLANKKNREAASLADLLANDCQQEARMRIDVATLVVDVDRINDTLPPAAYARFRALVFSGNLSEAVFCGDALLEGRPENCGASGPKRVAGQTLRIVEEGTMAADGTISFSKKKKRPKARPQPSASSSAPPQRALRQPQIIPPLSAPPQDEASNWVETFAHADAKDELPPMLPSIHGSRLPTIPFFSEEESLFSPRRRPWYVMGSGSLILAGGVIMAGVAQGRFNKLENNCPQACSQGEIDAGKSFAISADVLMSVGGAVAVSGAVWYFIQRFSGGSPQTAKLHSPKLRLTTEGFAVGGRF
jgi:hypothetical protein